VGTYDGDSLNIYVNGALKNSLTVGSVIAHTGPAPLRIGNIQNTGGHLDGIYSGAFTGVIDNVCIYDRALIDEEVSELYEIPEPCTLSLLTIGGLVFLKKRRA